MLIRWPIMTSSGQVKVILRAYNVQLTRSLFGDKNYCKFTKNYQPDTTYDFQISQYEIMNIYEGSRAIKKHHPKTSIKSVKNGGAKETQGHR